MNDLASVYAKIDKLERIVNLLLGKKDRIIQSEPGTNQFTDEEARILRQTISLFVQLSDEGFTIEELFEQLQYLFDINSYKEIEKELAQQYNSIQYGIHSNIYTFSFNGYDRVRNSIDNDDKIGTLSNSTEYFNEGIIILQCRPNLMIANENNILLQTANKNTVLTLLEETNTIRLTLSQDKQTYFNLTGSYDILSGRDTRYVSNPEYYLIHYATKSNSTTLRFISLTINIKTKTVSINYGTEQTLQSDQFIQLISDLPPYVTLQSFGSKTRSGNELLTIENLFISTRLQTFLSNLYRSFDDEFTNNNVNGLYGQAAAVGISQIIANITSLVRKVNADYELIEPSSEYKGALLPTSFPDFNVIDRTIFDLIGNSAPPCIFSRIPIVIPGIETQVITNYTPLRLKKNHYPQIDLLPTISGQIPTGYDPAQWRLTVKKTLINQVLSDGTSAILESWIETEVTTENLQSTPIKGTWIIVDPDEPIILDAQMDADFDSQNSIQGTRILVEDRKNQVKSDIIYKAIHGYNHFKTATITYKYYIKNENASMEGSLDSTITLQLLINSEPVNLTVPIIKQRILYGSEEVIAYIATIHTSIDNIEYYSGQTFNVQFTDIRTFPSYTTRIDNVPTSIITTRESRQKVTWTGKTELPKATYSTDNIPICPVLPGVDPDLIVLARADCNSGVQSTVPLQVYDGPYINYTIIRSNAQYTLDPYYIKTAYLALSDTPQATSFTKLADKSYDFNYDIRTQTPYPIMSTSDFYPVYCWNYGHNAIDTYNRFYEFDNLHINNQIQLYVAPKTYLGTEDADLTTISIQSIQFTTTDIFLPTGTIGQIDLSESITQLQTAVQFLEYYATYLKALIDSLEDRVKYVENTLDQIIDILTSMNQQAQTKLGFAGSLVSFLGTGIGMFFPLVGLGVSLIGGTLTSADKITQGDVVMGTVDLVVGGLMAALGLYKYNQRIERKYGKEEFPKSPYVETKNIAILPGYTIINNDPPPMYTSGRRRNGLFRNTSINSITSTTSESTTVSTTRISRQGSIWNDITWTTNPIYEPPPSISLHSVFIETITETEARNINRTVSYNVQLVRISKDQAYEYKNLSQQEFESLYDIDMPYEDYVKLELHYTKSQDAFNTNIGMDEDTFIALTSTNGYIPMNQEQQKDIKKRHRFKWNIERKNFAPRNVPNFTCYGPKFGIKDMYNALNPYRQLESAQIEMYNNCIDELSF